MSEENKGMKVPAKAKHKVKVITASNKKDLEKETNDFLETISDERRLNSSVFTVNAKTGEMIHIINYSEISPMSAEEWKEKEEKKKKFMKPFVPNDLMSSGEKVEKL